MSMCAEARLENQFTRDGESFSEIKCHLLTARAVGTWLDRLS